MLTFLATFAVFVLVVFGMSLGWIIKRKSIRNGKGLRLPGTVRCAEKKNGPRTAAHYLVLLVG